MTAADLSLIAFTLCNALRIAAYVPQMFKLARQPGAAVSLREFVKSRPKTQIGLAKLLIQRCCQADRLAFGSG